MEHCRVCLTELVWALGSTAPLCPQCNDLLDTMSAMQDPEWWWFFAEADEQQPQPQQLQWPPPPTAQDRPFVEQGHLLQPKPFTRRAPTINDLLQRIGMHSLYKRLFPDVRQTLQHIGQLLPVRRNKQHNDYVRQTWEWLSTQGQQRVDAMVVEPISVFG
jgi:hypothetical protein